MLQKTYTVTCERRGRKTKYTGTMEELVQTFSYTLAVGASYQYEKGNKRIVCSPKTRSSLVSNLNKAVTNAAANGCASEYYM